MRFERIGLGVIAIIVLLAMIPYSSGQGVNPIILSNIELVTVDESYARITWVTNLPANTVVQWGTSEELGEENTVAESVLYHMGKIDGLTQGTNYYYRIGSGGRWSAITSFTTLTEPGGGFKIKFAVVADTHYDVNGQNTANGNMNEDGPRLLESLVTELNSDTSLDFVITAGDLTNGDQLDFEGFTTAMDRLDVPWYPVLGNWDKNDENWYEWYKNTTGWDETYYRIEKGGYNIIVLDSSVTGEVSGTIDAEQFSWLETELAVISGGPTMIFMHHMADRTDIYGLDESSQEQLNAILLNNTNVFSIHSGHIHQNIVVTHMDGTTFVTTAAVVSYPIGYSIIKLYGDGYTQAFHKIEAELETSEESRLRLNTVSGNPNADDAALGTLADRSIVVPIPEYHPPPNRRPGISSVTLDYYSITVGDSTKVTVAASDPDDDELTYIYSTTGGTIEGSGPSVTYHASNNAGTYTIYVKVNDSELESEEYSIDVEVLPLVINHAPVLKSVIGSTTTVYPGGVVTIEVDASDEDGDVLKYYYEESGGHISGSGKSVEWEAPDHTGTFTISVWISDGVIDSPKEKITISVIAKSEKPDDEDWALPGFDVIVLAIALLVFIFVFRRVKNRSI